MKKKSACLSDRFNDKGFIKRLSGGTPHPDKDKIIEYLRSGVLWGQTSVYDQTTGQKEDVSILTDKEWLWDNLSIEQFILEDFQFGDSFLQHMKSKNYEFPELDPKDPKIYEL